MGDTSESSLLPVTSPEGPLMMQRSPCCWRGVGWGGRLNVSSSKISVFLHFLNKLFSYVDLSYRTGRMYYCLKELEDLLP